MPRYRVHRLVGPEFSEARAWYAGRSPVAAEMFSLQVDVALGRIERHPTAHAPWRTPFRRIRVPNFPYILIFHTDRHFTSVLTLVHQRQEPSAILAKVRERHLAFK